jgi:hypothetical protein
MYAGRQSRANGGGGDGGRGAPLRRRKQPGQSFPSSSSGRGEEAEEEVGGGKKLWRRKKQGKAVARAIRDGLPAAAASCWRGATAVEETDGRSRRRGTAADGSGHVDGDDSNSGEGGSGPGAGTPPAAWCCVCPGGDCSLEPNPSANGKEDPSLRSLLERNDFFAADCNPHADGLPSAASSW